MQCPHLLQGCHPGAAGDCGLRLQILRTSMAELWLATERSAVLEPSLAHPWLLISHPQGLFAART